MRSAPESALSWTAIRVGWRDSADLAKGYKSGLPAVIILICLLLLRQSRRFQWRLSTRILLIRKSACLWIFLFACFISTAPIKHCQLSGATFSFSKSQHSKQFKWALSDTGASMVWLKSMVFVFSLISSSLEQPTSANNSRAKTISSRSDSSWSYFSMDNCPGMTCTVKTWIGQIR